MGNIFCLMGKSASGKDTIYKKLMEDGELGLRRMVSYTTRPIRDGEKDGEEYHFVDEEKLAQFEAAGRVVELRAYHTVHGIWKYFTVCEEDLDLENEYYAVIGTLESWNAMRAYYGETIMVPIYIEVEDGLRLARALERERRQAVPGYEELCRRFLADQEDFSEENLKKANITRRFQNTSLDACLQEIKVFIQNKKKVCYN